VLDLDDYKWQEIKPKPGASWPSARSAFQFASLLDEVFLYGGYFKDAMADKDGSEKGVVHADMWTLDPRTWEWNKVSSAVLTFSLATSSRVMNICCKVAEIALFCLGQETGNATRAKSRVLYVCA
jgi:hypothetical protein